MRKLLLALLLGPLAGCSWIPVQEADLPPECQGEVCFRRAELKQLPEAPWLETASYRFAALGFRAPADAYATLQGPAGPEQTGLWRWSEGQALKIKQVRAADFSFPALANQFAASRYRVADYPELLFMQTSADPEPEALADRYIWRMALDNKGAYLASEEGLFQGEVSGLRFYYARLRLMQLSQLAFLIDPAAPEQIYQLMGYGAEPEWFEALLGTMHVLEEPGQSVEASAP